MQLCDEVRIYCKVRADEPRIVGSDQINRLGCGGIGIVHQVIVLAHECRTPISEARSEDQAECRKCAECRMWKACGMWEHVECRKHVECGKHVECRKCAEYRMQEVRSSTECRGGKSEGN